MISFPLQTILFPSKCFTRQIHLPSVVTRLGTKITFKLILTQKKNRDRKSLLELYGYIFHPMYRRYNRSLIYRKTWYVLSKFAHFLLQDWACKFYWIYIWLVVIVVVNAPTLKSEFAVLNHVFKAEKIRGELKVFVIELWITFSRGHQSFLWFIFCPKHNWNMQLLENLDR